MKKIFLTLVATVLLAPVFVSADSYNGPFCFEDKSMTDNNSDNYDKRDTKNVRGTCKEIETKTIVSIDPVLQKDYFLGTHAPIGYIFNGSGFDRTTKYSEQLFLTSSSTVEFITSGVEESPFSYALFGKTYFVPVLSKMFKGESISFSENNIPAIQIAVFKKDELEEMIKSDDVEFGGTTIDGRTKMDTIKKVDDNIYSFYSLNYQEYGKYIYAPKGDLVESQYVDVEKGVNILSDKDLQIEVVGVYKTRTASVVPVTSPLKSVTNYWLYTKKNGKLTFVWQKSEYGLDGGKVKTITKDDKNVNLAMLFSNSSNATSVTAVSPDIASSSIATTTSFVHPTEKKVGFITRFFNFILSWFK